MRPLPAVLDGIVKHTHGVPSDAHQQCTTRRLWQCMGCGVRTKEHFHPPHRKRQHVEALHGLRRNKTSEHAHLPHSKHVAAAHAVR